MRRSLMIGFPIVAFIAFMIATAGAAIAPSIQKLSGRFVCSGNYSTFLSHSETTHNAPGQTTTSISAYCANAQGHLQAVSSFKVVSVLFIEGFLVGLAVLLLIVAAAHIVRRRPAVQTAMA